MWSLLALLVALLLALLLVVLALVLGQNGSQCDVSEHVDYKTLAAEAERREGADDEQHERAEGNAFRSSR